MKKILIAEDEPSLAGVIADILQRKGFAVKTAENGLEAVKYIHTETFDLYILDVMMPKLSGWEVAGEIRKKRPTYANPVSNRQNRDGGSYQRVYYGR